MQWRGIPPDSYQSLRASTLAFYAQILRVPALLDLHAHLLGLFLDTQCKAARG